MRGAPGRPARLDRLRYRRDFLRVAATRRRMATPGLVLQIAELPADTAVDAIRIGFTASRKVGGAVARNRARRRLREAVARVMPAHAAPRDYVVIARKGTLDRPFAKLVGDLETALKKLDSWRDGA
ncbi:MAG: ribonuclease P protein component [Alphaproteobacteria bacterium]